MTKDFKYPEEQRLQWLIRKLLKQAADFEQQAKALREMVKDMEEYRKG